MFMIQKKKNLKNEINKFSQNHIFVIAEIAGAFIKKHFYFACILFVFSI